MTNEELNQLYHIEKSDRQKWKEVYPALSREQLKAYIQYKSTIQATSLEGSDTQKVSRPMKWASSRWNDGNYDIKYEMKARQTYRYKLNNKKNFKITSIPTFHRKAIERMLTAKETLIVQDIRSPFSNFYKCIIKKQDFTYHSVVQYMAALKARTFNDSNQLEKILQEDNPMKAYRLGLQVHYFDKEYWKNMYSGNHLVAILREKFTQNNSLLKELLRTESKILAFPGSDEVWCTGVDVDVLLTLEIGTWPGLNSMGELLNDLRDQLLESPLPQ